MVNGPSCELRFLSPDSSALLNGTRTVKRSLYHFATILEKQVKILACLETLPVSSEMSFNQ